MDSETISLTRKIPLALIEPPVANPREQFLDDEIQSLADSIAAVGLLHPVIVRPTGERFELIAGECRYKAVEKLGDTAIECRVIDVDDVEAAEIRLLENIDRKSLNAAEVSRGLRMLQELGQDIETLAALLRITTADVAAQLRLADLPAFWQAWLREDRDARRGAAAERLTDWLEFPAVLEAMQPAADRWPMSLTEWNRQLTDAVLQASRPMAPDNPDAPRFKPTRKNERQLQIVELRVGGELQQRAMNAERWDELQAAAVGRSGKATPQPETEAFSDPPPPRRRPLDSETPPADVDVLPVEDAPQAMQDDDGPADGDYVERVARWKDGWLRELITRRLREIADLVELEQAAELLGIDAADYWQTRRDFLELHSGRQLHELAALWDCDLDGCRNRDEAIALLLRSRRSHAMPQVVSDVSTLFETTRV